MSVNSQLQTPQDVSCTHILVFPTSATTQSSQTAFQETHITAEMDDYEILRALNDDDMPDGIDGMNEFLGNDIFWGGQSPTGEDRREEGGPGNKTTLKAITTIKLTHFRFQEVRLAVPVVAVKGHRSRADRILREWNHWRKSAPCSNSRWPSVISSRPPPPVACRDGFGRHARTWRATVPLS